MFFCKFYWSYLFLYRKGSVIADLQLTFSEPVGESEVAALLSDVVEDGKLGQFEVDEAPEGQY